jgi:hypothetical protein
MLGELEGRGWLKVEPPTWRDPASVIARRAGEPLKAGFKIETIEDSDDKIHSKYRSGQYNLEVRLDFRSGKGEVKVSEAEGYNGNEDK